MLVTSEWSQRTAMTTFSLEPRRMRIVMAKMLAGIALTGFVIVFALVVGLVCNLLYGVLQGPIDWTFGWTGFLGFLITQTFAMLGGFALACLLLNTPAAIVVFFVYKWVLPGLFALGAALMAWFDNIGRLDRLPDRAERALRHAVDRRSSGPTWPSCGIIWLVIPLLIGLWRIQRAEVK